jgi:hypothetical protein
MGKCRASAAKNQTEWNFCICRLTFISFRRTANWPLMGRQREIYVWPTFRFVSCSANQPCNVQCIGRYQFSLVGVCTHIEPLIVWYLFHTRLDIFLGRWNIHVPHAVVTFTATWRRCFIVPSQPTIKLWKIHKVIVGYVCDSERRQSTAGFRCTLLNTHIQIQDVVTFYFYLQSDGVTEVYNSNVKLHLQWHWSFGISM